MGEQSEDNWLIGVVVRFVCGGIFGVFVGVALWSGDGAWVAVAGTSLVCAILAAVLGDNFWLGMRGLWWRWWW